jgi:hypothetical protein
MGASAFSMTTQDNTMTSGQREWSFPSLSALCGHPRHYNITPGTVTTSPTLLERARMGRLPLCLVRPPVTAPSSRPTGGGRTANLYTTTLEAAPVRAQDSPRRPNRSEIRQDGRQLRGTARHPFTCRRTVRHACKLLSPWPIKGGVAPQPQRTTDSNHMHAFLPHHDIGTCLNQYLWDLEARPPLPPRL